jgi:hypothetical protein
VAGDGEWEGLGAGEGVKGGWVIRRIINYSTFSPGQTIAQGHIFSSQGVINATSLSNAGGLSSHCIHLVLPCS